jgi:hypothetical protein
MLREVSAGVLYSLLCFLNIIRRYFLKKGQGVLALGCTRSIYLKYILNIFKNVSLKN